jgi:hypothetical protein
MEFILITNNPDVARYAQDSGVHRIMVDLEIKGKRERQGHLNTVISCHNMKDIENVRKVLDNSKLLVRVNPVDNESQTEIDKVLSLGADIIMLPMFTTPGEVQNFINWSSGKAQACLLLETPAAVVRINEILKIDDIDEIIVGLNDLHLGFGLKFMFELLSGGIVEYLAEKISKTNIRFGFGGIARLGKGTIDSSLILSEHFRLNSQIVILSRDFYDGKMSYNAFREKIDLNLEIRKITEFYESLWLLSSSDLLKNKESLASAIREVLKTL